MLIFESSLLFLKTYLVLLCFSTLPSFMTTVDMLNSFKTTLLSNLLNTLCPKHSF